MEGGFYGRNRFDVQSAEMLDLISIAYSVSTKKILGGPAWLETDRFDVSALAPANSTPTTMRLMLRTLLAKRFGLVIRNETRDQPAYALTAEGKPGLTIASGSGDAGCKLDSHQSPAEPPATTPSLTFAYTCRAMTMEGLAKHLEDVSDRSPAPILDETGWKGAWDFNLRFTFQASTRMAALRDALGKQLGLKLEPRTAPAPVLAVVNVNRTPLPDAAGEAEKLVARYPKQFDVATLRPSQPGAPMTAKGLEQALLRISNQIHNYYLLRFRPTLSEEPASHSIRVRVVGMPDAVIQTRKSYWSGIR